MLDFAKKILLKVSFDRELFTKELRKAIKSLNIKEGLILYSWCIINFGDRYKDAIIQIFTDENLI